MYLLSSICKTLTQMSNSHRCDRDMTDDVEETHNLLLHCASHDSSQDRTICEACNRLHYTGWLRSKMAQERLGMWCRMSHWLPLLLERDPVPFREALKHGWSDWDRSSNMHSCGKTSDMKQLTIRRDPEPNVTDGVRGAKSYARGLHVWHLRWPVDQRGSHATVGVSTKDFQLQSSGYVALVGGDEHSWGWDIVNLVAGHVDSESGSGSANRPYPSGKCLQAMRRSGSICEESESRSRGVRTEIMMILDMDHGTLSFMVAGQFMGVAHRGLHGKILYPTVGAVWGQCEITLRYHGSINDQCPSLGELSRHHVCRVLLHHCTYNERRERLQKDHKKRRCGGQQHQHQQQQNQRYLNNDTEVATLVSKLDIPLSLKPPLCKTPRMIVII